jgi:hypothetical protein
MSRRRIAQQIRSRAPRAPDLRGDTCGHHRAADLCRDASWHQRSATQPPTLCRQARAAADHRHGRRSLASPPLPPPPPRSAALPPQLRLLAACSRRLPSAPPPPQRAPPPRSVALPPQLSSSCSAWQPEAARLAAAPQLQPAPAQQQRAAPALLASRAAVVAAARAARHWLARQRAGFTTACHAARARRAAQAVRSGAGRPGCRDRRRHAAGWRSDAPRLSGGQARRGGERAGRARRARRARDARSG